MADADHIAKIVSRLPRDFVWGTATSACQVEGAALAEGRKASIWDDFARRPGATKHGNTPETACDHYHRWAEDVTLLTGLGMGAYRFSLSWSRLLPDGIGAVNPKGFDFYKRLLAALREADIVPYVTLYHWDLPSVLQEKGGWTNRDILRWFGEYVDAVIRHLGADIPNFIVLNEPSVVAYVGHYEGVHAPGIKSAAAMYAAMHHLNLVHGQSMRQIKAAFPRAQAASTYTHFPIYPLNDSAESTRAAQLMRAVWSDGFFGPLFRGEYPREIAGQIAPFVREGDLDLCRTPGDFLGLNHYCPDYAKPAAEELPARLTFAHNAGKIEPIGTTDLGWPIVPDGLYDALVDLKTRYAPQRIIITEGGCAFNDEPGPDGRIRDRRRIDYYAAYLDAALRAREEGVPLEGYFAWSFLDNFEWAEGYGPRFGLVHVDYDGGLKRTPKDSYFWFRDLLRAHKAKAAA
ncbi:MAG: beta-glucosidase [Alphaproteobacteria bacterium]|nr:MAG: beta-glucosidase [Alphaproteobacteria bacterium]